MDPENVLVLTIFITIIIGIFIVLMMVLFDHRDQTDETYDKKQKTYDDRLKDRINLEKQEFINKLNQIQIDPRSYLKFLNFSFFSCFSFY